MDFEAGKTYAITASMQSAVLAYDSGEAIYSLLGINGFASFSLLDFGGAKLTSLSGSFLENQDGGLPEVQAVPLPAGLCLGLTGLAAFGTIGRKRRRAV